MASQKSALTYDPGYDWEPDKSLYEYGTERVEEIPDIGPVTIDDRKSLSGDLMSPGAMVRGWAPGVREQYLAWQPKKDLSGRDPHHCGKIAVLTALANGHPEITQEDWDFAVAFMTWQHEIRLVFTSGRAKTITLGEFKDTIMKEAEKRTKKLKQEQKNTKDAAIALVDGQEFLLIRWKAMSRDGKWFRFGWDAAKAIESLVSDGHLAYKQEYVEAEDGSSKGRWKADKAWVEWLG